MATPAYLKAFRDFIDASPHFGQLPAMENEFYLGSDRTAVILQASNVENILASLLLTKMRRPMANDVMDRLFEGNGPLATFSHKILMGFALELFGPVYRRDLDLIRELRNGFAHVRLPLELTTPEVAGVCANLTTPDLEGNWLPHAYSAHYALETVTDDSHPRTRFTRACHTMSLCLMELAAHHRGEPNGVFRVLP